MRWGAKKTWLLFAIVGVIYLIGHDLIFSKELKFNGLKEFIAESKQHIWHVAPIVIAFFVLLTIDQMKKKKQKEN